MPERVRELVLTGPGGHLESVRSALEPGFGVTTGAGRRITRRWLDSFDWRLYRAGLVLEQHRGRSGHELVLSSVTGELIGAWPGQVKTPGRLDPATPAALAARIGPPLGVRALLEMAQTTVTVREVQLRDAEEKLVARVGLEIGHEDDRPAGSAVGVGAGAGARVTVTPLRGYQAQARRAARLIAVVPGARPVTGSRLDLALGSHGRRAGDYGGRAEVSLNRSAPAVASVALVLLSLLDTVEANLDGVRRDTDSEFLHDLRVAVRRTRSALKLTGDVLPGGSADVFAGEFKWLGDLTTPVRDLDVYLLDIVGHAERSSGPALAPFHRVLEQRHRTERRTLVAGLRSARFTTLTNKWRETLTAAAVSGPDVGAGMTIGELTARRVTRAHRRLLTRGAAITPASPPAQLHDLRKRAKELRSLLDLFRSVYDPSVLPAVSKELKILQDCLGDFQDGEVQGLGIVHFADELTGRVPVGTLLAMGALAERLEMRKDAARADFADAFARFSRAKNSERMRTLTRSARG